MESSFELDQIVERLGLLIDSEPGPPAMVVMGPGFGDDGNALRGNRGGFLHLAVAALKAADGDDQSFERADWVSQYELDWVIMGLKFDPDAHSYFPEAGSGIKRTLWSWVGYVFLMLVILCLIVGVTTILRWL